MRNYKNPTTLKGFYPKNHSQQGSEYISYQPKDFDYHRHPYKIICGLVASFEFLL